MSHRPVASTRRQGEFADMADDFEAIPLRNTISDAIINDDQLVQFCDAAAEAKNARHSREAAVGEDGTHVEYLNETWGRLVYVARQRALEVVAEACATVIQDEKQWGDDGHWDDETIHEAQDEARQWMRWHTNETNRANVEEVSD
jgi:hypothetical protein